MLVTAPQWYFFGNSSIATWVGHTGDRKEIQCNLHRTACKCYIAAPQMEVNSWPLTTVGMLYIRNIPLQQGVL